MGILTNTVLYGNTKANRMDLSGTVVVHETLANGDSSFNIDPTLFGPDSVVRVNTASKVVVACSTSGGYLLTLGASSGVLIPRYATTSVNIMGGSIGSLSTKFSGTATNAVSIGGKTSTNVAKCSERINWWRSIVGFSRSMNATGTISAASLMFMGLDGGSGIAEISEINTRAVVNPGTGGTTFTSADSIPIYKAIQITGTVGGTTINYLGKNQIDYINGIKIGDLLFDNNGVIATVTAVSSNTIIGPTSYTTVYPSTITYRICWHSHVAWTCLEEGTMITMADWSQKPIEEVAPGDIIMGYDFEKNEPTPAVALTSAPTANDDKTNYFIFENGECLSCTEEHEIYSATKKCHVFARDLEEGEMCLGINGNEIEIYAIHKDIYSFDYKQFYQLVSSNNTYFANGILNAMGPGNKRNWLISTHGNDIPEEIEEIFKLDGAEYHVYEFLGENEEFRKKSLDVMENLKIRGNKIASLKQHLKDTDYITAKKSEGQEVDENILTQRQKNRDEINRLEEELNTIYWPEHNRLLAENSELGDDILLSNEERRSKYFFEACKRDNENFELFKKYYAYK